MAVLTNPNTIYNKKGIVKTRCQSTKTSTTAPKIREIANADLWRTSGLAPLKSGL